MTATTLSDPVPARRPAAPRPSLVRHPRTVGRAVTAALVVLLFLVPVLYVVMISLESPAHFLRGPMTPPTSAQVSNFSQAWAQAGLGVELANTAIYSVAASALSTVLALLIAFPLARRMVRAAPAIYSYLGVGLFLPLAIIPLFVEARLMHLWDNRIGYIIFHVEPGIPLGVVLLTAAITAVPIELDEAAFMDGAGYLRYVRTVIVPLVRPALLITFLYGMLGVWNDIIGPVVLLSSPNLFPITRGIYAFFGANESEWTLLAAAIVVASLPLVVLFALTQGQLVRAAVSGAVKG